MPLTRTRIRSRGADPIRTYSTRGFFVGWSLVLMVGLAMFAIAALGLGIGENGTTFRVAQWSGFAP